MAYAPAMAYQRRVHQAVLEGRAGPTLLLLEHEPVITLSKRKGAAEHLLADAARLAQLGIELQPTDRGGDITYHGPGQLVAYPILRLAPLRLHVGGYMRMLESIVIKTLAAWGVMGCRVEGWTGVWVGDPPNEKICAMGVRVRKNVAMHGLALNVAPELAHFTTIVPCGLAQAGVTSLARLLGEAAPSMNQVKAELTRAFQEELAQRRAQLNDA
jgi:lipoyl(octanoyl) transferase